MSSAQRFQFAWPPLTTGLKILLITYGVVFVFHPMFSGTLGIKTFVKEVLYLSNEGMFEHFYLWQPITYQLLHADFFHLLFNGMVLYFFGGEVEKRWNTKTFLLFAFLCGLGSALCVIGFRFIVPIDLGASGLSVARVVGASGAISGVVAAFVLYNWDRPLRLFLLKEIKGKWLLPIFIVFDIISSIFGENVSIAGHLGGMATGLLITILYFKPNQWISRLKLWRLRRKLTVMRGGKGPTLDDKNGKNGKNGYMH